MLGRMSIIDVSLFRNLCSTSTYVFMSPWERVLHMGPSVIHTGRVNLDSGL